VGEGEGRGQERQAVGDFGCAGGKWWDFGRAYGGAGGPERAGVPALIEVVFRNGLGLGKERDEREGSLAGWTDQGEHFVDPRRKGGLPGGPRGGCIPWLAWWLLWFGRRSRRSQGEFGIGARERNGEGIVLPGPGRDQRPQRSVGGEDAVVSVTVDAGRREDLGQPVQELERGEAEGGADGGIGLRQDMENLIRAVADQVEAVEGEGRLGTAADEPFQPLPVGSRGVPGTSWE